MSTTQQQTQQPQRQLSDEELDNQWQPNGRRPQSTLARSFSAELADIFKMDEDVTDLDSKVDKRKQTISMGTKELQSLEARLREMEQRIKTAGTGTSSNSNSPSQRRQNPLDLDGAAPPPPPKDDIPQQQSKRAPARLNLVERGGRPVGGNPPPTPGASEDGDRE